MPRTIRFGLVFLMASFVLASPAAALAVEPPATEITIASATFMSKSQLLLTGTVQCTYDETGEWIYTYDLRNAAEQGSGDPARISGNGGLDAVPCEVNGAQEWRSYAIDRDAGYHGGRVVVTADARICVAPASDPEARVCGDWTPVASSTLKVDRL